MNCNFEFNNFKNNLILGIKESFKTIQEKNENVYSYSLIVSSDLSYIGVAANTVEYLEDNIDDEDDEMYYKFCEQEWEIYNETNEYLNQAKELLNKFISNNHSILSANTNNGYYAYTKIFEDFRERVFDVCIEALYEVKLSNTFNDFFNNGKFINFMIPEYLDQEYSIEIFKKLNSGSIVTEYVDNIEEFL